MKPAVKVIGGGLAGSEAAWYLAEHGISVELYDCKPAQFTPAHRAPEFAELVCSNSLKSNDVYGNACGTLKEEMRILGSLILEAADHTRVPAGGALAVDREAFSRYVTEKLRSHANIRIHCETVTSLPQEGYTIVATGPLTQGALAEEIANLCGGLHFYDASAPIVSADSIDRKHTFVGDRYGKGNGDYLNCPLSREEYEAFVAALLSAEKVTLHDFEKREIFDGCMPIEVMAARGGETLRYANFKPVGLYDEEGKRPYAVLQLRRENAEGTAYNLVGCQTNLKFGEQKRVFSLIPALRQAEFLRYGVMHRNTYLPAPVCLNSDFSLKQNPRVYFAGQITGVEGYVESAMSGLLAAVHLTRVLTGKPSVSLDKTSVCGALSLYISTPNEDFQPMNANYGILSPLPVRERDKAKKKRLLSERAIASITALKELL